MEDLRVKIVQEIIEELKNGTPRWRNAWKPCKPMNLVSKREYTGINYMSLAFSPKSEFSNKWATFTQIKELGLKLKKGAKGSLIECWFSSSSKKGDKEKETEIASENLSSYTRNLRKKHFYVFNASDIEGFEEVQEDSNNILLLPNEEELIKRSEAPILFKKQDRAFYSSTKDQITMPIKEQFYSKEDFLSVLFHEMIHSTGHSSRLNRPLGNVKGSKAYALEELIAELGSVVLYAEFGLKPSQTLFDNNKAYIKSWASILENKEESLFDIMDKAFLSVDYIKKMIFPENQDISDEKNKDIA